MGARPTIVIPGDEPTQIGDSPRLDALRAVAEVIVYADRPADLEEKVRRAEPAEILLNSRGLVAWREDALDRLPRLRFITTCSIGTDMLDLEACRRRGIVVSNVPGRTAPVVAEHALALILAVARRCAFQTAELKNGRWTRRQNVFLAGKRLGLIGTGAIGGCLARLARGIGMQVAAWSFHPSAERAAGLGLEYLPLDELLQTSDVVSLHLRLSPESRGLLGPRELALLKPGAILVNTARGPIVDTAALVAALASGRLMGAGLDVFDEEPLPAGHPLLQCESVVLTPHHADQTPEGMDLLNSGAVENILAYLAGRPQHLVCP